VVNHPDQDFIKKSLIACRHHEQHPDLCGLCLKLFGSSDGRKITSECSRVNNIDLNVQYIPSLDNPADAESRKVSLQDYKLSDDTWNV
jgi:hypothetical protein